MVVEMLVTIEFLFYFKFIIYPSIDAKFLRHVQLKKYLQLICFVRNRRKLFSGFFCVFVKSVFDIRYIRTVF